MSLKEAQKIAREHGMSIRKTPYKEYRVNFKDKTEAHAVYEASVKDALDTAKAMYDHRKRHPEKYYYHGR